ncbi:MAG: DUF502 domain-containing protein [Halobacteria archaeon]|nr:DUF502 domain-containing protein [Halobacteria archaeon]
MSYGKQIRNSFIAGLALIAPLVITIIVLQMVFNWISAYTGPIVKSTQLTNYTANVEILAQIIAILLLVALITFLGFVATRGLGRRVFGEFDEIMGSIPIVRVIYSSVRQVSNTLMGKGRKFDRVVLVRWPRKDVYTIGFVTNDSPTPIQEKTGEKTYTVFLPMSPNPTAGHLLMIPEEKLEEVDMSVKEGIQMIMTTGMMEEGEKEVKNFESIYEDNEPTGAKS